MSFFLIWLSKYYLFFWWLNSSLFFLILTRENFCYFINSNFDWRIIFLWSFIEFFLCGELWLSNQFRSCFLWRSLKFENGLLGGFNYQSKSIFDGCEEPSIPFPAKKSSISISMEIVKHFWSKHAQLTLNLPQFYFDFLPIVFFPQFKVLITASAET